MTQVIRKLDALNRIVIPADYRRKIGIGESDEVRITEENGKIIIEKLAVTCKLCGATENIHNEIKLCAECIEKVKNL